MKSPFVVIIKASPWRYAHLSKNHPEYLAISNLIEQHADFNFILIGTSAAPLTGYRLKDNVVAWDIPISGITGQITYTLEVFRLLLKYRPRLSIVLGIGAVIPVLAFSFLSSKSKCVPIFPGDFSYHGKRLIGKVFNYLYFGLVSFFLRTSRSMPLLFALSKFEKEGIEKLAPNLSGQIELISYPIASVFNIERKQNTRSVKPTILTVAGIEERKGIDVLIKAVSLIAASERPYLIVKGSIREPDYMRYISQLVRDLDLKDNVTFVTDTIDYNQLASYYQSATLFVFPTRDDCLGIVLLEALYSNLPVVATNVGGIPEIIENGINGILVEPDDAHKLANAISTILKDDVKREKLSNNAKPVILSKYYANRITLQEALDRSIAKVLP